MLNIFNLFLFLLFIWIFLMFSIKEFSLFYVIFGAISSFLVSFFAFKLKFIEKDSEMLYLHLNFYRHFLKIFLRNFFRSFLLAFSLALSKKTLRPLVYKVEIEDVENFNPALLIATINMNLGLSLVRQKDKIFVIHALDEKYFREFNLSKTLKILADVNENNLV